MICIIGIDIGLNGGFVVIDEKKKVLWKKVITTFKVKKGKTMKNTIDVTALSNDIAHLNTFGDSRHVYVEKVSAMPGQGVSSMFSFGYAAGLIEMGLVANKIPYTLVAPITWTKVMHKGLDKKIDTKERSKIIVVREFPAEDLRATDRSTTPHSGLVDALLLAEYGRRELSI